VPSGFSAGPEPAPSCPSARADASAPAPPAAGAAAGRDSGAGAGVAGFGGFGASPLDPVRFLPAPGQGALALEIRSADERTASLLSPLHASSALAACEAERAFLRELGASCQVPVAAHARTASDGGLRLDGLVASLDGRTVLRDAVDAPPGGAREAGARLARILLERGARSILDEAEREVGSV